MNQAARAELFQGLHVKGNPVILYNVWDAGSAKVLQEAGAKAIATGSWSVAAAHGFEDGENLPLNLVIANANRIVASVDVPVSIDFEGGYGRGPIELANTVLQLLESGAVGINFEDRVVAGEGLYSIEDQKARIRAIRQAAEEAAVPLFINARTDVFLQTKTADHAAHMEEALRRAMAYSEAGASGLFAPGLINPGLIAQMCERSPLPVNIMIMKNAPAPKQLADLGVARISYGPIPYRLAMDAFMESARKVLQL